MGYPSVSDRLHTRYSPVRRSPSKYCYFMLPLDLHVLSLSLAFILSQDQTLHTKNFFIIILFLRSVMFRFYRIDLSGLALAVRLFFKPIQYLKELYLSSLLFTTHFLQRIAKKSGCKDNIFHIYNPNFLKLFFKKIPHTTYTKIIYEILTTSFNIQKNLCFFNTTSQHFHNHTKHHRINLKSGCKSRRIIFLFQTFL